MIWECFLLDHDREPEPAHDIALGTLWASFERILLARRPTWGAFLEQQGYAPFTPATFVKTVVCESSLVR